MANCKSAQSGGYLDSLAIDVVREITDNIKNACRNPSDDRKLSPEEQLQDSLKDMEANLNGLLSHPFTNCKKKCEKFL